VQASRKGGDGDAALGSGKPVIAYDSQHVDAQIPRKGMMGPFVSSKDNISTTQNLYNNSFSILRTALEYYGGKR
jgi:hypothetical protein